MYFCSTASQATNEESNQFRLRLKTDVQDHKASRELRTGREEHTLHYTEVSIRSSVGIAANRTLAGAQMELTSITHLTIHGKK